MTMSVKALSRVFRGKFLCALARLFDTATLQLAGSTAEPVNPQAQRRLFARLQQQQMRRVLADQ